MNYYFGFKPSPKLILLLNDIDKVTAPNSGLPYYVHRDLITHQVAYELMDTMLLNLIEVIPNKERQQAMRKIANKVESSTSTLLNLLLDKASDEDVLPTIDFLYNHTLFIDDHGDKRLGYKLDQDTAFIILQGFESVSSKSIDRKAFKKGLDAMNHATLDHFVTGFANSLPLGAIKRRAVPIAKTGIIKIMDIALNRLLPKLDDGGYRRLADFYRPFIVDIKS